MKSPDGSNRIMRIVAERRARQKTTYWDLASAKLAWMVSRRHDAVGQKGFLLPGRDTARLSHVQRQ
ncbi:hypothetical protein Verru16b_02987 [Lacunisphaera limnophila]|uniref:Uncharacterized protein n=1 Tax=Lacunisphaera limnophila TaxID=1838286 RepID=A0A1D8AYD1_9BACT|nr:hypothetical protein Verru16b_02987 [Lacunisphaera limnophila]